MTKMNRFLALMPVVAFAAACSGIAPTAPSQVTSNEPYESSSAVSAMSLPCAGLDRIDLTVADTVGSILWVQATYVSRPAAQPCPAPTWTSDRRDLVIDRLNPMRAGFPRLAGGRATLTARALNGVSESIRLDLGPTVTGLDGNLDCREVSAVIVKVLPGSSQGSDVSILASYVYNRPVTVGCTIAPEWSASRRGLKVDRANPFKASIAGSNLPTQVTAISANGIVGSVTF